MDNFSLNTRLAVHRIGEEDTLVRLGLAVVGDAQPKRVARCRRCFNLSRADGDDDAALGLRDIGLSTRQTDRRHENDQRTKPPFMEEREQALTI